MARRRRGKEEILDLSNRVFPYAHDFLLAFRNLSGGTIEYSQTGPRGMLSYPSRAHHEYLNTMSLASAFPVIRCDQLPVCRRGGFELWHTISMMTLDHQTVGEFELQCAGFIGRLRPHTVEACWNTLRCRITLHYKPATERDSSTCNHWDGA